jgi:hypothetical protein
MIAEIFAGNLATPSFLHTNIVPVWVITACPVMPAIVTNTVEEPVLGALSCACDTVGGGPFASVSKPGMELIF